LIYLQKLIEINRLILINFVVNQKDHGNSMVDVVFHKLKQNRKGDDDDDAVHKLCSQSSQSVDC